MFVVPLVLDEGRALARSHLSSEFRGVLQGCPLSAALWTLAMDAILRLFDKSTGEMLQEYTGHRHRKYRIDCAMDKSD